MVLDCIVECNIALESCYLPKRPREKYKVSLCIQLPQIKSRDASEISLDDLSPFFGRYLTAGDIGDGTVRAGQPCTGTAIK
jgi:hypothetical protein